MKRLSFIALALSSLMLTSSVYASAQARRPGQSHTAIRPSTRPGSNSRPIKRPGTTAGTLRPGTAARPSYVTPPMRPNRLPVALRPAPSRPAGWRPEYSSIAFGVMFGNSFGTPLMTTLDRLYGAGYTVDGYGEREVYLRNVTEFGYRWTDAMMIFDNGMLAQTSLYESTIGYDTSRYYGVFNTLRSLYGAPATRQTDGRNMSATWWSTDGQYITLDYTLRKSTNGYRYFTIVTMGR